MDRIGAHTVISARGGTMVGYEARSWLKVIFRLHGSVLPSLAPRLLLVGGVSVAAVWLKVRTGFSVPLVAHTLIGVALGLLLVFRTNASYDRYWEGRRLLGAMVNRTRDLARQVASWVDDREVKDRVGRRIKLSYALTRQALRRERDLGTLGALITGEESAALEPIASRAPVCFRWISDDLAHRIPSAQLPAVDANLTGFNDYLGGCERILKTPIPFAYAQHIKSFVTLFCLTVPFALSDTMGWLTPIAALIVAYALFGIEEIGVEIEDPFGYDPNDLPLDAIGQTIEGDVDAILGVQAT